MLDAHGGFPRVGLESATRDLEGQQRLYPCYVIYHDHFLHRDEGQTFALQFREQNVSLLGIASSEGTASIDWQPGRH
jgi:hypothetical protein